MAKRFNFRLETVLKLRSHKVQQAKEDLMQVVNKRTAKEMEISDRNSYFTQLLHIRKERQNVSDLQALWSHKNYVKDEIKRLETEKKKILEIEKVKRAKLTEYMKDEKILDKLKEKQKLVHIAEMEKEEQKSLDEIALNRFGKMESLL